MPKGKIQFKIRSLSPKLHMCKCNIHECRGVGCRRAWECRGDIVFLDKNTPLCSKHYQEVRAVQDMLSQLTYPHSTWQKKVYGGKR